MNFRTYVTKKGESILYTGTPDLEILENVTSGPGDLWHSSLDQGFKNCFKAIKYYAAIYWWYGFDFDNLSQSVSWRLNIENFAIRERVWNQLGREIDFDYDSKVTSGLDFGFNFIKYSMGVPLYVKQLYKENTYNVSISRNDRYAFFKKNLTINQSYYMLYRKGVFKLIPELMSFFKTKKKFSKKNPQNILPRNLKEIEGKPTVSLVIPTMRRQKFTQLLLEDHKKQTYLIKEAVIVDATPENEREDSYYKNEDFPFEVKVKWQTTKGSCVARNEALEMCTGDYIIFADDDIRIKEDFVENHIRLLQTYNAVACNGMDITADHVNQNVSDLKEKYNKLDNNKLTVGVSHTFSNANSCVTKEIAGKVLGNDINFDGGYGEDADYGLTISKQGAVVLNNPFSPILHLKPAQGGYRWWGIEASKIGKKRKKQPWELNNPVKYIRPIPSPTITYGVYKHFPDELTKEWRKKHFFIYLFKRDLFTLPLRLLKLPYKQIQFSKSINYAKGLINIGVRYK